MRIRASARPDQSMPPSDPCSSRFGMGKVFRRGHSCSRFVTSVPVPHLRGGTSRTCLARSVDVACQKVGGSPSPAPVVMSGIVAVVGRMRPCAIERSTD